jgi:hypothetical protein
MWSRKDKKYDMTEGNPHAQIIIVMFEKHDNFAGVDNAICFVIQKI